MPGKCGRCGLNVYAAEERLSLGKSWHVRCFTCAICNRTLDSTTLAENRELGEIYCKSCYRNQFATRGYGYGPNEPTLLALPSLNYVPQLYDEQNAEEDQEPPARFQQQNTSVWPPRPRQDSPRPLTSSGGPLTSSGGPLTSSGGPLTSPGGPLTPLGGPLTSSGPFNRSSPGPSRPLTSPGPSVLENRSPFTEKTPSNQSHQHVLRQVSNNETLGGPSQQSIVNPRVPSSPLDLLGSRHKASEDPWRDNRAGVGSARSIHNDLGMGKQCTRGRCGENAFPRYPPKQPEVRRLPMTSTSRSRHKGPSSRSHLSQLSQEVVSRGQNQGGASGNKRGPGSKLPLGGGEPCKRCQRPVYWAEMKLGYHGAYHQECFTCCCCKKPLESTTVCENQGEVYCKGCYRRFFAPHGIGYGIGAGTLQTF